MLRCHEIWFAKVSVVNIDAWHFWSILPRADSACRFAARRVPRGRSPEAALSLRRCTWEGRRPQLSAAVLAAIRPVKERRGAPAREIIASRCNVPLRELCYFFPFAGAPDFE
jgi:hypothetical protein